MCLTHSQLCQVVVSASKAYGLDAFKMCPDVNMGRSRTTATLRIQKRTRVAPRNIANHKNEQEFHHSNIMKWQTSESCTTATLWITKRTRASPRQDCELQKRAGAPPQQRNKAQYERELHHSNIANQQGTEWLDTLSICPERNFIWTNVEFVQTVS